MIWPLRPRRALPIDRDAWLALVESLPFLEGLTEADGDRLRALVAEFLSTKTFSGVHGLVPDDAMRLAIAAQACLPVLHLGLGPYDDFVEIVVHPTAFAVRRERTDDDGVVHDVDDVLAGESMDGGPVVLSWEDVHADARGDDGCSVVIHEFAHKLDLRDGEADGCPPMSAGRRSRWQAALDAAYQTFTDALDAVQDAIPADIDPESADADAWFDRLPLDPYAGTDRAEFFAVAAEAFFVDPRRVEDAFPALYVQFVDYFRQDPGARLAGR